MEEHHRAKEDELEQKILVLNKHYVGKVKELKVRMTQIDEEYVELDLQKTMIQNERVKMDEKLEGLYVKLAEETELRLKFEDKINSLHHVNVTHAFGHKAEVIENERLAALNEELEKEKE